MWRTAAAVGGDVIVKPVAEERGQERSERRIRGAGKRSRRQTAADRETALQSLLRMRKPLSRCIADSNSARDPVYPREKASSKKKQDVD